MTKPKPPEPAVGSSDVPRDQPAKTSAQIINSPTFKTAINISPEDIEAHNKRQAEWVKRQNDFKTQDLRRIWRAPERHVSASPQFTGDWGARFKSIGDMINSGRGVTIALVGERGNGKTQMSVELMRVATKQLKWALFTTAMGFFIAVKTSYRRDAEKTEENIMLEYGKPNLLVIDEIGKRSDSEWENNMLFELLNRRYNAIRDTILICNKSKPDFEDYLGPSIASRMNETGGIIECNWPSFRQ